MLLPWSLLVFAAPALALVNVTIDDELVNLSSPSKITYVPAQGAWKLGPSCSDCTLHPDPTQAFNATWHVGTFDPTFGSNTPPQASLRFHGSAVYVYCILSLSQDQHIPQTNLKFYLDNQPVGTFEFHSVGQESYIYNIPVYSNTSLPMADHTFVIQNGHEGGHRSSVILDYIIYSTEETVTRNDTAPNGGSNTVSALTGILIAFCILLAGILGFFLYRLWKMRQKMGTSSRNDLLPIPGTSKNDQPFLQRWFTRFRDRQESIDFNPSLLTRRRPLPSYSAKTSSALSNSRPQSGAILAPDDPVPQKPVESRWASVMSWRDRTVREGEIPSLPPTSHAPTTVFSGPTAPNPAPLQTRPIPNHQQHPRKFTVMNG